MKIPCIPEGMEEAVGGVAVMVAIVALGLAMFLAIRAFIMLLAAKMAGVRDPTFRKAVVAVIASMVFQATTALVLHEVRVGGLAGALVAWFILIMVIKASFQTSFLRAALLWLLQFIVVLFILAVVVLVLLVLGVTLKGVLGA